MVNAIVYATDNEEGANGHHHYRGNANDGSRNIGSLKNDDNSPNLKNDANHGNWNDGNRNIGNDGRENGNDGRSSRLTGNVNQRNAVDKAGDGQKNTREPSNKTAVVQHVFSTPAVQAPVVVLLVTYSAEAQPSVSGSWWNVAESYAEGLFRKFFFLSGSIGEKIRRKDVLRNRKRREIYNFVVNNPFSHFRRITRMVRVGPNEGSWHLRILERMGFIESEYFGRYLVYHANNSRHSCSRGNQRISLIPNSNATKILEYLTRNPGTKIAQLAQALMMNRHTISYHIKRMQTSGLIERVERNGLRLSPIGKDEEGLVHFTASPVVSGIECN